MFVSRSPRSGEANSRRVSPPPAKMTLFQPRLMKPAAVSDVIRGHLQPKGGAGGWSDAWSLARDRCSHAWDRKGGGDGCAGGRRGIPPV